MMTITISHSKEPRELIRVLDKTLDDIFKNGAGMLQVSNASKAWSGNTMTFSLVAGVGFLSAPIHGTVLVAEKEVTIEADLGLFEKFITPAQAKAVVESRTKGLLT
jgi:hypothetical protein